MRKIVDSNYLQSDKLYDYLSNHKNQVVLPDQVSYEAFSSDYYKSLKILSRFPDQVLILKRTETITKLSLRGSGLQKRMIDFGEVKRFKDISEKILDPKKRDIGFLETMNSVQIEVKRDLDRIKNEASKMSALISDLFSSMKKEQAKLLRNGPPYDNVVLSSIRLNILNISERVFSNRPDIRKPVNRTELQNSYVYRSLACSYFLSMEWHLNGGLKDVKTKTMMNDMFDSQIATYATFFDGFLSNDAKAKRSYNMLSYFLLNTKE